LAKVAHNNLISKKKIYSTNMPLLRQTTQRISSLASLSKENEAKIAAIKQRIRQPFDNMRNPIPLIQQIQKRT
jgi:DnaJ-domain-containing protein 1